MYLDRNSIRSPETDFLLSGSNGIVLQFDWLMFGFLSVLLIGLSGLISITFLWSAAVNIRKLLLKKALETEQDKVNLVVKQDPLALTATHV